MKSKFQFDADFFRKHLFKIILTLILATILFDQALGWIFVLIIFVVVFNKFKFKIMPRVFESNGRPQMPSFQNLRRNLIFAAAGLLFLIVLANSITIIDAGETGVFSLFGKVRDRELSSGIHLVNPLGRVTKLSIRTEEYTMSIAQGEGKRSEADAITSLTKEGLSVDLDMTVLYRLDEERASEVYRTVGLEYDEKIIRPLIRTSIRDVVAQYEAKAIYSDKRQEVAQRIREELRKSLEARGILVEDILLRNVALPANLEKSIQEKLQAEQEAQKYDFLLQKEEKEKQRKIVEAEGQREAQKIINESLSNAYLYYLYINNLKDREGTIYVPTNSDSGLPLFKEVE